MLRRTFLQTCTVGAEGALFSRAAQPVRPNILWITCEDTSPDLGCYGDPYARTPNLDRLATEGARFLNAFTVAGVCAPSRSGIITGMYPSSIGTHHMRSNAVPPPFVKCFPEYLRAEGYYCTNNLKTDYNFDAPRTAWDESGRNAHWRNRSAGQPFFCVFNIVTTHESRIRAPRDQFESLVAGLRPEDRHDPRQAPLPPYYPDTPIVRRDVGNYYDLVSAMDLEVGRILRELEADGLAGDTVVFFYGDHGRGLTRSKYWIYDSGIHIPLLIRWPGRIAPGSVADRLVSGIDFGPTVLSIAGIAAPPHMQGRAFLGGHDGGERQYVYAARDRIDEIYDIIRCVRDKRYKYIRNYQPGKPYAQAMYDADRMPTMQEMRRVNFESWTRRNRGLEGPLAVFFAPEKPVEELYDTANDPHEVNNLAGSAEHGRTLVRMRAAHQEWMRETSDLGVVPEMELRERMRPGGQWATTAAPVINPAGGAAGNGVPVRITCATEGASIAYTVEEGAAAHWKLYSGGIRLNGACRLRAVACRLGYRDSSGVAADFHV